jgi:hypothetical protein
MERLVQTLNFDFLKLLCCCSSWDISQNTAVFANRAFKTTFGQRLSCKSYLKLALFTFESFKNRPSYGRLAIFF